MTRKEFDRISRAVHLAITRILDKGTDDVFKPPIFSRSIESAILALKPNEFRQEAYKQALKFIQVADLEVCKIGLTRRCLVTKDQNSFRQAAWLDPFDAVKYLSVAYLLFEQIEANRIVKNEKIIHSHRMSQNDGEIFDHSYGYDSFRMRSSQLSREYIGKWKVVTDISNFFDRIGNHSLENHLLNVGCEKKYVTLIKEMLLFWAGDRRSFGVPVGSDASRILSEAVLLSVDQAMRNSNLTFIRYVDDFRVFSETKAEALKAIEILTTALAEEGLSLNSRKTEVFKIMNSDEASSFTNRFELGEHERLDLEERIEMRRIVRASGRSSISRFYREPGKEALKKIKAKNKDDIINNFINASDLEIEQEVKLLVKYFVYVDQDPEILRILIERRITTAFYIADALVGEASRFSPEKCEEIKDTLFNAVDWAKCAYPFQVPILRVSAHPSFMEPKFVRAIIDGYLQTDSMVFYREAISLGYPCLDRSRLRKLAIEVFGNVPDFVGRAIYSAIKNHQGLPDDEKRPLLKNMKQHAGDWFIEHT